MGPTHRSCGLARKRWRGWVRAKRGRGGRATVAAGPLRSTCTTPNRGATGAGPVPPVAGAAAAAWVAWPSASIPFGTAAIRRPPRRPDRRPPSRRYPIHIPETSTATSRANTPTTAASNAPPFDWAGRIPFPFHLFSIWIRVASSRESVRISYNVDNLFRIRSLTACTNTLMVELDLFLKNDSLCHSIGFFQYRAPYISMVNGNSTVTPPPPDYSDILVFCNTLTLWLVRIRSKIRSVFKKIWFKFWFPQLGNWVTLLRHDFFPLNETTQCYCPTGNGLFLIFDTSAC